MRKVILSFLLLISATLMYAQVKVKFILNEKTAIRHDSIYVTGSFCNWDSMANNNYLLKPQSNGEKSITLILKSGPLRYKFHRGSWKNVEKQFNGNEVPDRLINLKKDSFFIDSVMAWRDLYFLDKWQSLNENIPDTSRVRILGAIASTYAFSIEYYNADSALNYAQQSLQLIQKMKTSDKYKNWFREGNNIELINMQEVTAALLHSLGNYPKALEIRQENLMLAEKEKDKFFELQAIINISADYVSMKDYQSLLKFGNRVNSLIAGLNVNDPRYPIAFSIVKNNIANAYYRTNQFPAALNYAKQAIYNDTKISIEGFFIVNSLLLADIYAAMNETDSAMRSYRFVHSHSPSYAQNMAARAGAGMARIFQKQGRTDSALFYARQSLTYFQTNKIAVQSWGENTDDYIAEISPLVADLYNANNQPDSAYKYLRLSVTTKDSLYNTDKIRQFQTLGFNETSRRQQLEEQKIMAQQQLKNKIRMLSLIAGLGALFLVALILYRNNKQKQKANALLQSQKQEIETTLGELKTTQSQLIQSEKMASLGELTAGIAHEIQNPLNFINNFSEVNTELITEMKEQLALDNKQQAIDIANDIAHNEEKINHHGKRADAIVKGMLQHSRSSSGVKEPTDINALADEYLRLAYHGLRAKDKSFNATMKTDYDETLKKVKVIPQDIGRVILNLITNAFYVVNEKKKAPQPPEEGAPYDPTVFVSTKKITDKIEIRVSDNGNGIPQKVLDKIFQPFFTTKPTGQGTGLGLSLSYDIVKAHGGELKVETQEGEGSTFIIQLPAA